MKLYTSRYQNKGLAKRPELLKIGITAGRPRWTLAYPVAFLSQLAPARAWLHMEREEYEPLYLAHLGRLGAEHILELIAEKVKQAGAEGAVLLCYEDLSDPTLWCHRTMLATYLQTYLGIEIPELPTEGATTRLL